MSRFTSARNKLVELSENQKAATTFIKFFVVLVVLGVIGYSEFMFLNIVSVLFPTGIAAIGAIIGAVATGCSVALLYAGKSHWFTPGAQLLAAWIFTGVEVCTLIMNDVLAYAIHDGNVDSWLAIWQTITPASPVFALIGWIVVTNLDTSTQERHSEMEMEARKSAKDREYREMAHAAEMDVKTEHLNQVTEYLKDVMASAPVQAQIQAHAARMVAGILTDVSGIQANLSAAPTTITPLPSAQQLPAQLAQTSSVSPVSTQGISINGIKNFKAPTPAHVDQVEAAAPEKK
jgi:hypothetical protein